jgi:hypothetical protein
VTSRFVRKVRTSSGAVAVQVVTRDGRQVVEIDHVGSAHTDAELELLLRAAQDRVAPGQEALDLGPLERRPARLSDVADWTERGEQVLPVEPSSGRPRVVAGGGQVLATSSLLLWEVLTSAYTRLGFDVVGDEAFRALVLARIIEPTSKADTVRVLGEVGAGVPGLNTIYRSLKRCQQRDYRSLLAKACLAHSARTSGRSALILYDVTVRHEALVVRVGVRDPHRGACRSTGP